MCTAPYPAYCAATSPTTRDPGRGSQRRQKQAAARPHPGDRGLSEEIRGQIKKISADERAKINADQLESITITFFLFYLRSSFLLISVNLRSKIIQGISCDPADVDPTSYATSGSPETTPGTPKARC